MNWQEYDSVYGDDDAVPSRRSRRTKFREFENHAQAAADRIKRSGKRSHRPKNIKDDDWAGHDR